MAKGFSPIVFCRFIHTADYVAEELRKRLRSSVEIASITGILPPADREARIAELAKHSKKVLVCTDCLSEGINLQDHFDAVMHYDLSWNPTRHEQREGRVDRFGQPKPTVRVLTYYGKDNPIDGIVIDVLIQKHKKIRSSLGISVPVPADTDAVMEAMFEGLLMRNKEKSAQLMLDGFDEYMRPKKEDLHTRWDDVSEREKKSRTMFARESIRPEEVALELEEARSSTGSAKDVQEFTVEALKAHDRLYRTAGISGVAGVRGRSPASGRAAQQRFAGARTRTGIADRGRIRSLATAYRARSAQSRR